VLAENRRSIEGLLATLCAQPVYTVMASGAEFRGREAVAGFYRGLFAAMPDATFDLVRAFVSEDGVMEESLLRGTPIAPWNGLPPTGRAIALPLVIVFPMKDGEIQGERLYFDMDSARRQLAG
jgi:carboxymethylenebutenolidase